MAKKITKKLAGKSRARTPSRATTVSDSKIAVRDVDAERRQLEVGQISRALKRAKTWIRLLDLLDIQLDQAHELFTYGLRLDAAEVKAEYERRLLEHGEDGAPLLHQFHVIVKADARHYLCADLQLAANRLPLLSGYVSTDGDAFSALLDRLRGLPHNLFESTGELIATVIRAVRRLLEEDLSRARLGAKLRSPSNFETEVLRALLSSSTRLSGEELAQVVQRKAHGSTQAQAIFDAVSKLRFECGFEIPRNDAGYTLSDNDREQAEALCIVV